VKGSSLRAYVARARTCRRELDRPDSRSGSRDAAHGVTHDAARTVRNFKSFQQGTKESASAISAGDSIRAGAFTCNSVRGSFNGVGLRKLMTVDSFSRE